MNTPSHVGCILHDCHTHPPTEPSRPDRRPQGTSWLGIATAWLRNSVRLQPPLPLAERVQQALATVPWPAELGTVEAHVIACSSDGRVELSLVGGCPECGCTCATYLPALTSYLRMRVAGLASVSCAQPRRRAAVPPGLAS